MTNKLRSEFAEWCLRREEKQMEPNNIPRLSLKLNKNTSTLMLADDRETQEMDCKLLFLVTCFLCLLTCSSNRIVILRNGPGVKSTDHKVPSLYGKEICWLRSGIKCAIIARFCMEITLLPSVDIWQMTSTLNRRVSSPF